MVRRTTTWGIGDYPRMAAELEPVAAAAVGGLSLGPGVRVLDVATGTGNAALLAAQVGASVTAVDIEPVLIEVAERRADAQGAAIRWLIGSCELLPVPDASFDVVLSVLGVMYAADHGAAARELSRVTAPSGRVVLASWRPGGVMPGMGQALGPFLPAPPPSSGPPSLWGDPDALQDILRETELTLERTDSGRVTLRFSSATEGASFLIDTAGHVVSERERLTQLGRWTDLHGALREFVDRRAVHSDLGLEVHLDYLLATASKAS